MKHRLHTVSYDWSHAEGDMCLIYHHHTCWALFIQAWNSSGISTISSSCQCEHNSSAQSDCLVWQQHNYKTVSFVLSWLCNWTAEALYFTLTSAGWSGTYSVPDLWIQAKATAPTVNIYHETQCRILCYNITACFWLTILQTWRKSPKGWEKKKKNCKWVWPFSNCTSEETVAWWQN